MTGTPLPFPTSGGTAASLAAALRSRADGVPTTTVMWRLILWRLCARFGLHPVIRAHSAARLRMYPARADHGIAKGVFLLRDRYEPSVRSVIDTVLGPGDTALDIGANMGLWTLRMAERVGPAGRVIAFEPGPVTGTRLRDNIALSGARQVVVHGLALGAEPGELVLHTPRDSGSASLGAPDEPATQSRVRVERLDKIWQAAGSPRVALVKMDVEGAEPMVLAGASAFFSATRPVVCCEINPTALRRLGFGPGDVLGFFHQRGYCAMIWHAATQRLQPHAAQPDADAVEDVVFLPQENRLATAQPGART